MNPKASFGNLLRSKPRGIIPSAARDCSTYQFRHAIRHTELEVHNKIIGVMGIQDKKDVYLIRHAYVTTKQRKKGIGSMLIQELIQDSTKPILIGTWKAAHWAISFYERYGFKLVSEEEKNILLRKYWNIPARQVETSVVLVDEKYNKYF